MFGAGAVFHDTALLVTKLLGLPGFTHENTGRSGGWKSPSGVQGQNLGDFEAERYICIINYILTRAVELTR